MCGHGVEPQADLGQLTAEEVCRGRTLPVVEVPLLAVGSKPLLQPEPRHHQMTAPFEVCRGLGQDLGPTSR